MPRRRANGDSCTLPDHPPRRGSRAAGVAPADDDDPFGFEKKPKYKQSRKKMRWRMERAPLISGVKTRFVPRATGKMSRRHRLEGSNACEVTDRAVTRLFPTPPWSSPGHIQTPWRRSPR